MRRHRVLIVLAALMGAAGVVLAAGAAHLADASRLAAASSMLLFHATAVLAAIALSECALVHPRIGMIAAFGFVVSALLFAGDLSLRQYAGHGLFPMAAPTGGTLLIASWLVLALAAAAPRLTYSCSGRGLRRALRRGRQSDRNRTVPPNQRSAS